MGRRGESDGERRGPWSDAAATGLAAGAALLLCEIVKATRSSLWTPPNAQEIQGAAAAWAAYALAAAVIAVALCLTVRLLTGSHRFAQIGVAAAPIMLAAGLYGAALFLDAPMTSAFALSLFLLVAAFGLHRLATSRRALAWPGAVSIVWAVAGLAGVFGAVWAANEYLLSPHRGLLAPAGAAVAAAFGFGIGQSVRAAVRTIRLRTLRGTWRWPAASAAACAAWATLMAPALLPSPSSASNGPPIILITADTMRADVSGLYGGPALTPNLEAIADSNAAVFERGYALAPWTLPSMFGLFASYVPPGLTPGAGRDAWKEEITLYRMPGSPRTLAEILRDRGYNTGAFVANSLLRDPEGILRGFDEHIVTGHRTHTLASPLRMTPFLESLAFALGLPFVEAWPVDTTRLLTAQARAFIAAKAGRSYFLWVHFMDPHTAFAPPRSYLAASWPWRIYCNADPFWGTPLTDGAGRVSLTEEQQLNVRALYEGETEYVDSAVGAVWDAVAAQGAADAVYFAFTSDHGEELWEHGAFGHGHTLFDELVRVPLLLRGPGIRAARIEGPISCIDLMPTLADLAGAAPDETWQGRSLAAGLRGEGVLAASPAFARGTNAFAGGGPLEMVAADGRKLILDIESGLYTLYDIETDPAERRDLLNGMPPPADLETLLAEGMKRERRTVRAVYDSDGELGDPAELDAQMRGMGYIR